MFSWSTFQDCSSSSSHWSPTGCSFWLHLNLLKWFCFPQRVFFFNELTLHPMKRSFQKRQFHSIAVILSNGIKVLNFKWELRFYHMKKESLPVPCSYIYEVHFFGSLRCSCIYLNTVICGIHNKSFLNPCTHMYNILNEKRPFLL